MGGPVRPTHLGSSVQSEASPKNAARERSRVRTLRQAFLALQAALPAVPPDTKLSKLDVLVLATSYIAHLTRTLGHELPGPAWPPFLRGLHYLHPLKVGHEPRASLGNGVWDGLDLGPLPRAELTWDRGPAASCCLRGRGAKADSWELADPGRSGGGDWK